ncbi:VWA domain-containing protein [Oleispirillum naphthae]|uniref:VWA domain-containing protein n=1 Tax=Oleispirillum naphthae TaxID=2838853 RepID=UPI003082530A
MNFVRSDAARGAAARRVYPFSAVLAQEEMKLALLLNAVNPAVGGVVVRGQKGTAKSTAARGLRDLLPALPDGGRPAFVDFPLGATEDMVIGSIDFEAAVRDGAVRFQPGLLARAHMGVLYIDEVNLLDDHLVDSILDAAESGANIVEREGQSLRHASRFILIGTMNPEEGELRPQLLDRFGLAVSIAGESDPQVRVELLKRREAFDADPDAFLAAHAAAEADLALRLREARKRLAEVRIPPHLVGFIAEICQRNHVAGHRADIVMERAARAFAAWAGRTDVTADDILAVAPMALLHRMRAGTPEMPPPPPPPPPETEEPEEPEERENPAPEEEDDTAEPTPPQGEEEGGDAADAPPPPDPGETGRADAAETQDEVQEVGASYAVRRLERQSMDQTLRTGSGRRSRSRSASKQGRYVKSTSRRGRNDLALDATIRAAAPYQKSRREQATQDLAVHIARSDIREKIRERRVGNFLLFVVDGSGSMGAQRRMVETKAAVMSLLLDAYQKRDKVAMVVFRGRAAEVVLPPTNSVDRAAKLLADLPVGGRTPLTAGLAEAAGVLRRVLRKEPTILPLVIVMTDGRANAALGERPPHEEALAAAAVLHERYPMAQFVVVDTETKGVVRLELARKLATALEAAYFKTEDLRAEDLVSLAKEHQAW